MMCAVSAPRCPAVAVSPWRPAVPWGGDADKVWAGSGEGDMFFPTAAPRVHRVPNQDGKAPSALGVGGSTGQNPFLVLSFVLLPPLVGEHKGLIQAPWGCSKKTSSFLSLLNVGDAWISTPSTGFPGENSGGWVVVLDGV